LDELVKNDFLKDYLLEPQGAQASEPREEIRGMRCPFMVRSTPSLEGSQDEDAPPPSGRSMHKR